MRYPEPSAAHGSATARAGRRKSFAPLATAILLIAAVGAVPGNALESSRGSDPIVTRAPVTEDRSPVLDSVIPSARFPVGAVEWGTPWHPVDRGHRGAHTEIAGISNAALPSRTA